MSTTVRVGPLRPHWSHSVAHGQLVVARGVEFTGSGFPLLSVGSVFLCWLWRTAAVPPLGWAMSGCADFPALEASDV